MRYRGYVMYDNPHSGRVVIYDLGDDEPVSTAPSIAEAKAVVDGWHDGK